MGQMKSMGAWLAAGSALLALGGCDEDETSLTGGSGGAGAAGTGAAGTSGPGGAGGGGAETGGSGGGIVIPEGGGGSGGGVAIECDLPPEPGSIYELEAESLSIEFADPVPMCIYRGEVMLIVNVAAQ